MTVEENHSHNVSIGERSLQSAEQKKLNEPKLIFLFGLTGAGKSTAGQYLRDKYGFELHEGDDDFTDALRDNIRTGKVSTLEERDEYNLHIIEVVRQIWQDHDRLVVAQMFPLNRHRAWLREQFPSATFIWVQTQVELIDDRLELRRGHRVDKSYAQKIRSSFEIPDFEHFNISNNGDSAQLEKEIDTIMDSLVQEE